MNANYVLHMKEKRKIKLYIKKRSCVLKYLIKLVC